MGWVVDFAAIDEAWSRLKLQLDHRDLNLLIENPTSENLAYWILMRARETFGGVWAVELQENPDSVVRVELGSKQGEWRGKVGDYWKPEDLEAPTAKTSGGALP